MYIYIQIYLIYTYIYVYLIYQVNPSVCDRDGNEKIFCKVHTGFRADKYAIFIGIAVFAMEVLTLLALLVQQFKSC